MNDYPIYLVDDDDSVRRSVGFMLRTSGFTLQVFESGLAFLHEVGKLDPGCVLLDIRMPGMDGLDVQQELNNRGVLFPVVIMTGHGDVELAVKAMKGGALDFIEKPFEKVVLTAAIKECYHRLEDASHRHSKRDEAKLRLNGLTPREHDVLAGLVEGYPNKTIGYDLGISPRTVEIHRANLMNKLEVQSLSDLLRIAFAAGVGENRQTH
ncbi:response regulator [Altererythrobacter confluentis]|uniref:Response regulator n=1 Tax=Allopontixanthobacter confluentis TaxID=1849021 RepID=A0A6L7GCK3_9SPHN|nr:response regulator [Allopontixanthobacter confluentis]MXP13196.1 response regulator [Allopontixanthobacter confluentis]